MIVIMLLIVMEAGILILNWEGIREIGASVNEKIHVWADNFKNEKGALDAAEFRNEFTLKHHLFFLLRVTMGLGTEKSLKAFEIISVSSALLIFSLLFLKIRLELALAAALFVLCMPYFCLRIKLSKIRIESSREGEILVTELLNYYKMSYFNMQQAIEKAAAEIEDAPVSRILLMNLAAGLNKAGTEAEIKRLMEEFKFSINTSWGNVLASNMLFALISGTEVSEALGDLTYTVRNARKIAEYSKRENNEAAVMLRYLTPASYAFTVAAATGFFGLSMHKYIYYQFKTEVGLTWFVIFLIVYLGGLLLNSFLENSRLDI